MAKLILEFFGRYLSPKGEYSYEFMDDGYMVVVYKTQTHHKWDASVRRGDDKRIVLECKECDDPQEALTALENACESERDFWSAIAPDEDNDQYHY